MGRWLRKRPIASYCVRRGFAADSVFLRGAALTCSFLILRMTPPPYLGRVGCQLCFHRAWPHVRSAPPDCAGHEGGEAHIRVAHLPNRLPSTVSKLLLLTGGVGGMVNDA